MFLLRKLWSMSRRSRLKIRKYYGNEFYIKHPQKSQILQIEMAKKHSLSIKKTDLMDQMKQLTVSNTTSWILNTSTYTPLIVKRFFLIIIALLFGSYGIIQLLMVINHFENANTYCSSIVNSFHIDPEIPDQSIYCSTNIINFTETFRNFSQNDTLQKNPSLLLWDQCTFKVYPFDFGNNKDNVCQCRQFRYHFVGIEGVNRPKCIWTNTDLKSLFNIDFNKILSDIFIKWKMLEKIQFLPGGGIDHINFTSNMFGAEHMKIVQLSTMSIDYFAPEISNWKQLEYIELWFMGEYPSIPETALAWTQLQYIALYPYFPNKFPMFLCSCKKLKKINIRVTGIEFVPECVTTLKDLQFLKLYGAASLKSIPLKLFNNEIVPNLVDINIALSQVSIDNLIEYNDLSSIAEFNKQFSFNKDIKFWCVLSSFCKQDLEEIKLISPQFAEFINDTACCKSPCKDDFVSQLVTIRCEMDDWQDGVCDPLCNFDDCYFDGGDCRQLCDFEKCDYRLLGNGECNAVCNSTECNYDEGDCIISETIVMDTLDLCIDSGCNPDWLEDGWCDRDCNNKQCQYDERDKCGCVGHCEEIYTIFQYAADLITDDQRISMEEICAPHIWNFVIATYGEYFENCTEFMRYDINDDDLVSLHEVVIVADQVFSISREKALQLDCSRCTSKRYYY